MVGMINVHCLREACLLQFYLPRKWSGLSWYWATGNGDIDDNDDSGWAQELSCTMVRILMLPHKARGEVSIIAVQVKVSVEYAVKSSEFKFHEIRVNETCLSGGVANLPISLLRWRSSFTKRSGIRCWFILGTQLIWWARKRSRYSDSLRAGWSGDPISEQARFSAPLHTGPGAHSTSCTTSTGSLSRV